MSGTSLDGVDAAWLETDGERISRLGPTVTLPYDADLRKSLRHLLDVAPGLSQDAPLVRECAERLTQRHVQAVEALGVDADLLGFHGQTILHRPRPRPGRTWQIGCPEMLADAAGIPVAFDFRSDDVAAGGHGAPLVPVVHAALAADLPRPLAILNLGGVGNVTWIGPDAGAADGGTLLAFDTGPANAPIDDWARRHTGEDCDRDGRLARAGVVSRPVLDRILAHPYLAEPPPKSLDRLDFHRALEAAGLNSLSPQDGAATLVALLASCVAAAARHFPGAPRTWLVAGGGRQNPVIMSALAEALDQPVQPVEAVGLDGGALEAQAFGVLAARVARGLPLTFPGTTGVPRPMTGGRIVRPGTSGAVFSDAGETR